jgi:hypothetical protein
MISNLDTLSTSCAAALHNVAQTAAGKQALCKHMAGLVEALRPAHAWDVARLALDTISALVFSADMGQAAVLQYRDVAAVVHAVQQRLAGTSTATDSQAKMRVRQQYILLVQHLLQAPQGIAFFSRPDSQVLDELLTQVQFQFESGAEPADREAAGSCIELLAAAALDGLWALHLWQLHKRLKDAVHAAAKVARQQYTQQLRWQGRQLRGVPRMQPGLLNWRP